MVNWNTEQIMMQKQDKIKSCLNLRRCLFSWLLSPMSVTSLIQIHLVFTIMSIFLHIHIQTCLRNLIFNPFGSEFPSISAFTLKHLRCHAREGLAAVSQCSLEGPWESVLRGSGNLFTLHSQFPMETHQARQWLKHSWHYFHWENTISFKNSLKDWFTPFLGCGRTRDHRPKLPMKQPSHTEGTGDIPTGTN